MIMALPQWLNDLGGAASSLTSGLGLLNGLGSLFGIGSGPSYEEQLAQQWEYSQKAMMMQYQNQLALQKDSQNYNTFAANQANKLQQQLLKMQQNWQSSEWSRQFQAQNAYNNPTASLQRLRQAGLNTSVLAGGNLPSITASSLGANASAPSAPASHMATSGVGSASLQGVTPNYYDFTVKRRESLQSIQQIARSAKELGYYDERSRAEINNLWANLEKTNSEERLNDVLSNLRSIEAELNRVHGHSRAKAEINNILSQTYLSYCQGDYTAAQRGLVDLEKELKGEEIKKMSIENKMLPASLRAMIDKVRADAQKARAEAVESGERVNTERALRPLRVTAQEYANEISKSDAFWKDIENHHKIQNLAQQYKNALTANQLMQIEKQDKDAYTSFQRVILGKGSQADYKKVLDLVMHGDPIMFGNFELK